MEEEMVYFTRLGYNDREFAITYADKFQFAVEKRPSSATILHFDTQMQVLPQSLGLSTDATIDIFCSGTQRRNFQGVIIHGATPLIYACYHGYHIIARHLVEHTSQPCSRDSQDRTALMWACCNVTTPEALDCAILLMEKEAGMVDAYGNTALMYLVENKYLRVFDKYLTLFSMLVKIEAGRFNQANNTALMLFTNSETYFDTVLSLDQIRFRKNVLKELCLVEGPLVAITNMTAMSIFLHNTEHISPFKHNDYLEIIDCLLPYEGLLIDVKAINKTMFRQMCQTEEGRRRVSDLITYRPFKFRSEFVWGEYGMQQLQKRLHAITLSYIETTKQRLLELSSDRSMQNGQNGHTLGLDFNMLSIDEDPLIPIIADQVTSVLCCTMDEASFSVFQNSALVGCTGPEDLSQLAEVSMIAIPSEKNLQQQSTQGAQTVQDAAESIVTQDLDPLMDITVTVDRSKGATHPSILNTVTRESFLIPAVSAVHKSVEGPVRVQTNPTPLSKSTLNLSYTSTIDEKYINQAEGLLFTTYVAKNMYHVVFYYLTSKQYRQRRMLLYSTHTLPGTSSHITQLTRNKLLMALELGHVEVLLVLLMLYYHDHVSIPFAPLLRHGKLLLEKMDGELAEGDTSAALADRKAHLVECIEVLEALNVRIDTLIDKIKLHLGDRFLTALELLRPTLRAPELRDIDLQGLEGRIMTPE